MTNARKMQKAFMKIQDYYINTAKMCQQIGYR
nr:MAG TPA: hypothetical protein [Caudoviricetes sp.]